MTFKKVIGNIFDSDAKYLVHQTNCVSRGQAGGIAGIIFAKLPYADCYSNRVSNDQPGTIDIRGDGSNNRYVVNLMGQFEPGRLNENSLSDKRNMRQYYFHTALISLAKVPNLQSVVFPAGIGCAIAGGNWNIYLNEIEEFYYNVNKSQQVDVSVYCLPMNIEQFNFKE